jgi:hypothetical protein
MKRLLLIGFAACAVALASTVAAPAMPAAHPSTVTGTNDSLIQVHGHHGGRGHHYGWGRGHHYGWGRHHHHW